MIRPVTPPVDWPDPDRPRPLAPIPRLRADRILRRRTTEAELFLGYGVPYDAPAEEVALGMARSFPALCPWCGERVRSGEECR